MFLELRDVDPKMELVWVRFLIHHRSRQKTPENYTELFILGGHRSTPEQRFAGFSAQRARNIELGGGVGVFFYIYHRGAAENPENQSR